MSDWPKNRYVPGDQKAMCQNCGFVVLASELKRRYDGLLVDDACFDPKPEWMKRRDIRKERGPHANGTPFTYPTVTDDGTYRTFDPVSGTHIKTETF